jgi:hypothetical protein
MRASVSAPAKRFWIAALAVAAAAALASAPAAAVTNSGGGMLAESNGRGSVTLVWFPTVGHMPAGGWRLSELSGGSARMLVARIAMGDPKAMSRLSADDAASIKEFQAKLGQPLATKDLTYLYAILGIKAFTNSAYAAAAGLTWTIEGASGGDRSYQVTGLSASGAAVGPTLQSPSVNPSVATRLPAAPTGLRAVSTVEGVVLYWDAAQQSREVPVMAYRVEREGGGQHDVEVTNKPLVLGTSWKPGSPEYTDAFAPTDTKLTYRVYAVDPFERKSAAATFAFFATDMRAIDPVLVSATAGQNETTLHWKPRENPHTAGYVVERSNLYFGPYVPLTRTPLGPRTGSYTDRSLHGGSVYYYRVFAVSPQGDLGPPSMAVSAQPKNEGAPAQVVGLHADAGSSRVRLTWHSSVGPIAGYFVERRSGSELHWETLNGRLTQMPFYDDFYGLGASGTLAYRIVAVGFDNKQASPSETVVVTLVDRSPPAMPYVRAASGRNGVVTIEVTPAAPAAKTAYILALRSGERFREGIVIGDPIPASAHAFVDRHVEPGQDYWYRFVAVDRNGNRSDATDPVVVHVGSAPLPNPHAPSVAFGRSPFAHVRVSFGRIPAGLQVVVQRQVGGKGPWVLIAGPMPTGTAAVDANPPLRAKVAYRILYQVANGARSAPSTSAAATIP